MQFTVKKISNKDIKNELKKIGFDSNYIDEASKKHIFSTYKIENLTPEQATIIKQTALSKGADAGIHRDVLTHKKELSDLILSGTIKQIEEITNSLLSQPFNLKEIAKMLSDLRTIDLVKKPKIMGILNLTPDSFSDGGCYIKPEDAIKHAGYLIEKGAEIIDIGAESTRPMAEIVPYEEEIKRIGNVIKEVSKLNTIVSCDTRNAKTAEYALENGAKIINDVSGLEFDPKMKDVIKNSDCDICIVHSKGTPRTMDDMTEYNDIRKEVYDFLKKKIEISEIDPNRIIIDTGFGFAKDIEQNYELLRHIKEFNSMGVRHLAGISRKRFLQNISDKNNIDDISALGAFYLFENNIDIVRVHNVEKAKTALNLYTKIYLQ